MNSLRPPLVTDLDRKWAIDQRPSWARTADDGPVDDGEIVDDGGWLENERSRSKALPPPNWADFVDEQASSFERFFAGQTKSYAEWSALWRKGWWPKANPEKRFPKSAPKVFQPFFRRGSPEFDRALEVANPGERPLWERFGVAQFKPDDPRLRRVRGSSIKSVKPKEIAA